MTDGRLTVTSLDLGVDLDATVLWDHLVGNWDAFVDWDALLNYRVVLHTAPPLALTRKVNLEQAKEGSARCIRWKKR